MNTKKIKQLETALKERFRKATTEWDSLDQIDLLNAIIAGVLEEGDDL